MNLGILTVQGLVNSFGTVVMAAFAARREDRRIRLHAGAGLRQRVLHVHRAELRREASRNASATALKGAVFLSPLCLLP